MGDMEVIELARELAARMSPDSLLDAADVAACVHVARQQGVPLSIRGVGHHVSGDALSDAGLTMAPLERD